MLEGKEKFQGQSNATNGNACKLSLQRRYDFDSQKDRVAPSD